MSELISGKEALIALANGEDVEFKNPFQNIWIDIGSLTINEINSGYYYCSDDNEKVNTVFRIKPKTIMLNGIKVPTPFEPKDGDVYFYLNSFYESGYDSRILNEEHPCWFYHKKAWRTESEIKQVVSALRSIFKGE